MKIIAITQARVGSTRLPNKVLKKINGQSLLEIHLNRIKSAKRVDKIIVATTVQSQDKVIYDLARNLQVTAFRGSENDVLDRFYHAAKSESADYVVRLTSDCPLIDGALIDKVIDFAIERQLDYCSNTLETNYPDGQDIEVFKFSALKKAWLLSQLVSEREHVTPFIWKNSTFKGGCLFLSDNFQEGTNNGHLRMTVDEPSDFELIKNLIDLLGTKATWLDYANYMNTHSELSQINAGIQRNEGLLKSIQND